MPKKLVVPLAPPEESVRRSRDLAAGSGRGVSVSRCPGTGTPEQGGTPETMAATTVTKTTNSNGAAGTRGSWRAAWPRRRRPLRSRFKIGISRGGISIRCGGLKAWKMEERGRASTGRLRQCLQSDHLPQDGSSQRGHREGATDRPRLRRGWGTESELLGARGCPPATTAAATRVISTATIPRPTVSVYSTQEFPSVKLSVLFSA